MRVEYEELAKLFEDLNTLEEKRLALREVFSHAENIDTFSKFCFPHAIKGKVPDFHKEIYNILFLEENSALAAPRGFAKSTITGLVYVTYCIVNKLEKYIVYMSQSHSKTVQFIEPVRDEFRNNKWLHFIYGDLNPTSGKDGEGRDREDCIDISGIRLEAASFEKNIRGFKYGNYRPTLIICDDIESDDRVLNPDLRVKDSNKLNRVIIPSLDVDGRFKFIGTILHVNSLLMNKLKKYKGPIFKGLDSDNKSLWPERYSYEKLMKIKKDIGSISFQQEIMNDPVDNETSIIKRQWVEACLREDLSVEEVQVMKGVEFKTLGVDFAFSDRITADESAFTGLSKKDDFYYLSHIEKIKGWSVLDQLNHIKIVLHKKHRYDQIGLEENSIKSVSKDIGKWNLPVTLYWTAASDPKKNKNSSADADYFEKRHTVGKTNLIFRLGTAFENKRFIIPYKTEKDKIEADRLIAELTSYALSNGKLVEAGVHPDLPIALGYALELMDDSSQGCTVW